MPIYEFYCHVCNRLFNFFSSSVNTEARPQCPRCDKVTLERRPARFATIKKLGDGGEDDEDNPFPGLDEERLEQAMESLAGEMDAFGDEGDEDPRAMARFFRRFGDVAGMRLGPRMEEMLRRLESGEDLDHLEEEMGGDLDEDDESLSEWFEMKEKVGKMRLKRATLDDELYFL